MPNLPRVVRVLSNNAVLACLHGAELVLVGRGIGFSRSVGDFIDTESIQHRFVEVSPDRAAFMQSASNLSPIILTTINAALDLAGDLLGELHPSVYLVLADHLAFAVQRQNAGELIESKVFGEVKAAFPAEFSAAELMVRYLNSNLDTELPLDEAAFIALHLNAAITGKTVKAPLSKANILSSLVEFLEDELQIAHGAADDDMITSLLRLSRRVRNEEFRRNDASKCISLAIPRETSVARQIIKKLAGGEIPKKAEGEVAYFAMKLHGWLDTHNERN
ncbi:PRD domain-containing protein [Arcanobacterium hippocoleae]|uniref:Transcriptional antiterminator n=1 Tax=Arcanobacterium hippocoleae TaxID=149017 RepID=A0ABU1T3E9_9ACTO|nr:PRD domain-containing protein [Arcanobacterium hippocoleae]MDR6939776.1 transcriptional antiterminator [Arcanobacterium hippocoleae]